jgi:transposase
MSNPRYSAEMRERAVKMVLQVRRESGQEKGAISRVAQQLGVGREALRGWVAQAEVIPVSVRGRRVMMSGG